MVFLNRPVSFHYITNNFVYNNGCNGFWSEIYCGYSSTCMQFLINLQFKLNFSSNLFIVIACNKFSTVPLDWSKICYTYFYNDNTITFCDWTVLIWGMLGTVCILKGYVWSSYSNCDKNVMKDTMYEVGLKVGTKWCTNFLSIEQWTNSPTKFIALQSSIHPGPVEVSY